MDKNCLDQIKKAKKLFSEAIAILNSGPASYYFEQLVIHSDALLSKYAKYKIGDRVRLSKTFMKDDCGWGWYDSLHFLIKGSTAKVDEVGYDELGFYYGVVFDHESWIDRDDNEQPVEHKHCYSMRESSLEPIQG